MEINNRIKELKKFKEMSTEEFSAIGGVSLRSQQMYESGKTIPTAEYCAAIANRFKDVNMDWLLTGEGTMLKGGVAGGESFSDEDLQILRMIKRLPPTQKKHEITNISVVLQSIDEAISHYIATNGGELQQRQTA